MDVDQLQELLDTREGAGTVTVQSVSPIAGGYSRSTARAHMRWTDGTEEDVILRGDPEGQASVFHSDRAREWGVLTTLAGVGGFEVPRPRWFDATGEHMGAPCIVSEAIDGHSLFSLLRPGEPLDEYRRSFVASMAAIHGTPLDALTSSLPMPASWEDHMDSFGDRYRALLAACDDTDPVLAYVEAKYRTNRPVAVPLALVHGDWQPGNVLVRPDGSHVIIDWEFTHVGDPREDFGYLMMLPFDPDIYYDDPEAFCQEYRRLSGLTDEHISPEILEFFKLVGFLTVHEQVLAGLQDLADGQDKGPLGPYLVNTATHFAHLIFDVARALPSTAPAEVAS